MGNWKSKSSFIIQLFTHSAYRQPEDDPQDDEVNLFTYNVCTQGITLKMVRSIIYIQYKHPELDGEVNNLCTM